MYTPKPPKPSSVLNEMIEYFEFQESDRAGNEQNVYPSKHSKFITYLKTP